MADSPLSRMEQRLQAEYSDTLGADVIAACIREAEAELGNARLHHFVPVLVERDARRRLRLRACLDAEPSPMS